MPAEPPTRRSGRRSRGRATRSTDQPDAQGFRNLYFGKAAAENEVAADPERFLRTYFDRWDLPDVVGDHSRFLVLGPKGAGKSAAAAYVALSWARTHGEHAVFSTSVDFDELNRTQTPLTALDKRLVADEVTSLTDAAWRLFLGVRLLESLIKDNNSDLSRDPQALKFLGELRSAGLASDDYPRVLRAVREKKGTIGVPRWINGELSSHDSDALSPGQIGDAVLDLVLAARTPNRHLLAIDGLDKAIANNDAYWLTLAALIRVADSLRRRALQSGATHLYVLIMCRSDVFRRAHFADAPKIAADGGVHIGWHAEAADPRDVLLWEYLSRKAEVSAETLLSYLPRSVPVGGQGGVDTLRYALDFTRYTPRDISLLFGQLRQDSTPGSPLSGNQVRMSADTFASHHLLQEIVAEATGLLPSVVVERLQSFLSALPKRVFTARDVDSALDESGLAGAISSKDLGEYLFLQGAIGNYQPDVGYIQFYHRRDAYKFKPKGPWVLHTGLVYAMNIPWVGI